MSIQPIFNQQISVSARQNRRLLYSTVDRNAISAKPRRAKMQQGRGSARTCVSPLDFSVNLAIRPRNLFSPAAPFERRTVENTLRKTKRENSRLERHLALLARRQRWPTIVERRKRANSGKSGGTSLNEIHLVNEKGEKRKKGKNIRTIQRREGEETREEDRSKAQRVSVPRWRWTFREEKSGWHDVTRHDASNTVVQANVATCSVEMSYVRYTPRFAARKQLTFSPNRFREQKSGRLLGGKSIRLPT